MIPSNVRGNMSAADFCELKEEANVDNKIQEIEKNLAASRNQEAILSKDVFSELVVPVFDVEWINEMLKRSLETLDANAAKSVMAHLGTIGEKAEAWVAQGMELVQQTADEGVQAACPFCAQKLENSPILKHYRAFFGLEYAKLKKTVSETLTSVHLQHGAEKRADFERSVRIAEERRLFWKEFCEIPEIQIDTEELAKKWRTAHRGVVEQFEAKKSAPLDSMELSDETIQEIEAYMACRKSVVTLNLALQEANSRIAHVKTQVEAVQVQKLVDELAYFKLVKARYSPEIDSHCNEFLGEKKRKTETEKDRDNVRDELNKYRQEIFPVCQEGVNNYLMRFGANFTLGGVSHADTRGGPTCKYDIVINGESIPVSGKVVELSPTFRNTLSAGDRNTLALAFFFASLDQDRDIANKVVVIDDPISSLDEHRALTTVQEIRRLSQRVKQLLVLSHNKPFLCNLWEGADKAERVALEVVRSSVGSTIRQWDVTKDCITEHDRRHELLRHYRDNRTGDPSGGGCGDTSNH